MYSTLEIIKIIQYGNDANKLVTYNDQTASSNSWNLTMKYSYLIFCDYHFVNTVADF